MTTTCKPCGATFGGRIEHCCACHASFTGTTAGDRHRTGNHAVASGPDRRRCLTADEMLAKGMDYTENAHGTRIWGTGARQEHRFYASPRESEGLTAFPWGNVPPTPNEARKSEPSGVAS